MSTARRAKRLNKHVGVITGLVMGRRPDGRLALHSSFGRILERFVDGVERVTLCAPLVPYNADSMDFVLPDALHDVVCLPPMSTTVKAQRYSFEARRRLRALARDVDGLFVRVPFQVPHALQRLNTPMVAHIVGNPIGVINASTDYQGLMKIAAKTYAQVTVDSTKALVAQPEVRTVTNGRELWEQLRPRAGRVVVSSSIRESELTERKTADLNDPVNILFVGFLRPEKGVTVLVDAFDRVRARHPVRLHLVGGADRDSEATRQIERRVASSPYTDDIIRYGAIDFGPELFERYREADVYVLPSFSEGTPRTLVEARGFGCAAVASRVGGVPTAVDHGQDGLMVPAGDADALADAIEKLIDDDALRARLVVNGQRRVRAEMTLEAFVDQLIEELRLAMENAGR